MIGVENFPTYLQYRSGIRLCKGSEIQNAWRSLESFFDSYCRHLSDFWNDILDRARPDLIVDLESYTRSQAIILDELGLASHLVPGRFPTSGKGLRLL